MSAQVWATGFREGPGAERRFEIAFWRRENSVFLLARMLLHERSFYIVDELTIKGPRYGGTVERALSRAWKGLFALRTVRFLRLAAVDEVLVMEDGELVASGA